MIKRQVICHLIAASFSLFVVTPLVWMAIDRQSPIKFTGGYTVPDTITPGLEYVIKWNLTLMRDGCEGTIFRTVIDSQGTPWATEPKPSLLVGTELGKSQLAAGRPRILQSAIPDGPARILTRGEFVCEFLGFTNPFHLIWPIKDTYPEVKTIVAKP